jgi:glycine cleavage system H protein
MTNDKVFDMGKYPARLPGDRRYARNHMWALPVPDGRWRFGFTAYAVRLMQDVYFLDWSVNAGDAVHLKQQVGHIETSKAVADLFAPVAGTITAFHDGLLQDPSAINTDTYGDGWLLEMAADAAGLMDVGQYHDFLAAGWENTQRMLKGQM